MLSEETDTRTLCVPLPSDYLVGGDDPNAGLGGNAGPLSTQAAQALGKPCPACPIELWAMPRHLIFSRSHGWNGMFVDFDIFIPSLSVAAMRLALHPMQRPA